METLSFGLGIAFVVVIAIVVVAVYALVKVLKLQQSVGGLSRNLQDTTRDFYNDKDREVSNLHRRIDNVEESIYRAIDSRLDRLENKLIPKEQIKK